MTQDNSVRQTLIGSGKNETHVYNHPIVEASNETKTLIAIINHLSSEVERSSVSLDIQFEKNINKKFYERFKDESQPVIEEFTNLIPLYGVKYADAQESLEIGETRLSEIAVLISHKSKEILKNCENKFVEATEGVIRWLCEEISTHIKQLGLEGGFSQGAIRFFVCKKLEECDVFPNEVTQS